MKKFAAIVFGATLVASLVACGVNTKAATNAKATAKATTTSKASDNTTADEAEPYSGTLRLVNKTDEDITELYMTLQDGEFGDNMLKNGDVLKSGESATTTISYYPDTEFKLQFVNDFYEDETFENITVGNIDNPEEVTLTITEDFGDFSYNVK